MKITSAAQIQRVPQNPPMKPSTTPVAIVRPKKTHRRMLAASETSSSSRMRTSLRSSFRWNATVTGCTRSSPSTLAMCRKTIQRYMTSGHSDAIAARTLFEELPVPFAQVRRNVIRAFKEAHQRGGGVCRCSHRLVGQDEFATCSDPSRRSGSDRRIGEARGRRHRVGIELRLRQLLAAKPETGGDQLM